MHFFTKRKTMKKNCFQHNALTAGVLESQNGQHNVYNKIGNYPVWQTNRK